MAKLRKCVNVRTRPALNSAAKTDTKAVPWKLLIFLLVVDFASGQETTLPPTATSDTIVTTTAHSQVNSSISTDTPSAPAWSTAAPSSSVPAAAGTGDPAQTQTTGPSGQPPISPSLSPGAGQTTGTFNASAATGTTVGDGGGTTGGTTAAAFITTGGGVGGNGSAATEIAARSSVVDGGTSTANGGSSTLGILNSTVSTMAGTTGLGNLSTTGEQVGSSSPSGDGGSSPSPDSTPTVTSWDTAGAARNSENGETGARVAASTTEPGPTSTTTVNSFSPNLASLLTTGRSSSTAWRTSAFPGWGISTTPTIPLRETTTSPSTQSTGILNQRTSPPHVRDDQVSVSSGVSTASTPSFGSIPSGDGSSSRFSTSSLVSSSVPEVAAKVTTHVNGTVITSDSAETPRQRSSAEIVSGSSTSISPTTSAAASVVSTTTTTTTTTTPAAPATTVGSVVSSTNTNSGVKRNVTDVSDGPRPSPATSVAEPDVSATVPPSSAVTRRRDGSRDPSAPTSTATPSTRIRAGASDVGSGEVYDASVVRDRQSEATATATESEVGKYSYASEAHHLDANRTSLIDDDTSSNRLREDFPRSEVYGDFKPRDLRRFAVTFIMDATNMTVSRWFQAVDVKFRSALARVLRGDVVTNDQLVEHSADPEKLNRVDLGARNGTQSSAPTNSSRMTSMVPSPSANETGTPEHKSRRRERMVTGVASRGDISANLDKSDVSYLDPTPVRAGKKFYVSVLVRNGRDGGKQYIQAKTAQEILKTNTTQGYLERQVLDATLVELMTGVPEEITVISQAGASRTLFEVHMPLMFAVVSSLCVLLMIILVAYCFATARKRKFRNQNWKHYQLGGGSGQEAGQKDSNGGQFPLDNAMELNCPQFLSNSNAGVHLANDEDCIRGEEEESRSGATIPCESAVDVGTPLRDFSSIRNPPPPPHATANTTTTTVQVTGGSRGANPANRGGPAPMSPLHSSISSSSGSGPVPGQRGASGSSSASPASAATATPQKRLSAEPQRHGFHHQNLVPAANPAVYRDWPTPLMPPESPGTSTFGTPRAGGGGGGNGAIPSTFTNGRGTSTFAKESNTRL